MPIVRNKIHCAICGSISNRTIDVDDTVLCEHCFDMMLKNGFYSIMMQILSGIMAHLEFLF